MSFAGRYFLGGSGTGPVETITGNVGGAVSPSIAGNINIVGTGSVTVTGNPGTNTQTISVSGEGLAWSFKTSAGNVNPMAANNGYFANDISLVEFLLPATSAVGDVIRVVGIGYGLWQIRQGAGQQIVLGNRDYNSAYASIQTTAGVAGSITSALSNDSVELVCSAANTTWRYISGTASNLTVI